MKSSFMSEACRAALTAIGPSREIEACETRFGSVYRIVSELLAGKRGLWFYAGWIDQAVLHVGKVEVGDERLFAKT